MFCLIAVKPGSTHSASAAAIMNNILTNKGNLAQPQLSMEQQQISMPMRFFLLVLDSQFEYYVSSRILFHQYILKIYVVNFIA